MRRFASVFTSKREKSTSPASSSTASTDPTVHDSRKNVKRAHTVLSVSTAASTTPPSDPSTPQLSAGSDHAHSSSSSSGSTSLRTPDDQTLLTTRTPTMKRSMFSWLGSKKPSSSPVGTDHPSNPGWETQPPPALQPPPLGNRQPLHSDDTDEDTSSDSEDDYSEPISHSVTTSTIRAHASPTIAQSRENLLILTANGLIPPLSPSPFVHTLGSVLYPRSCNIPRFLPTNQNLRSTMHKTHLLRRLASTAPTDQGLTRVEEASILPFGSRPIPTVIPLRGPPSFNEEAIPATTQVTPISPGLSRWIARPCFEDRFVVWIPVDGSIIRQGVSGTSFAVADLEYSEAIEYMAGFALEFDGQIASVHLVNSEEFDPGSASVEPPQLSGTYFSLGYDVRCSCRSYIYIITAPSHSWNSPYIAVPSPLRMEHNPGAVSPGPSTLTPRAEVPPAPAPTTTVKRGVRFAEDDKDDQIPLGYVLRMKQRKEEKAKFLREQKEKRALALERAKLEEERRKREKERNEWEMERRAWENEKKTMEEERRSKLYAEEVAASRARRESSRAGISPSGSSGPGGTGLVQSASSTSLRESERNRRAESKRHSYSRPLYDSTPSQARKQFSDPNVQNTSPPSLSPHHSGSPANSRPPSIASHSPTMNSQRNSSQVYLPSGSRPPSLYMSSSEDVRLRRDSGSVHSGAPHRNSVASTSGRPPSEHRSSSYSNMWVNVGNPSLLPPVPPIPPFAAMDMPLLPPTPPFMLQQYPRPRSQHSVSPARSSERMSVHYSSSSGRPSPSPSRHEYHSNPPSPSQSRQPTAPTHQRRSSGDTSSRSSHHDPRPHPVSSHSQPYPPVSRGRMPHPASNSYLQLPSPWTALPSQDGSLPVAMPTSTPQYTRAQSHGSFNGSSTGRPPPNRRQTIIS